MKRILLWIGSILGLLIVALIAYGSWKEIPVAEVSRTTTATPEEIWALWEDVPGRKRWDKGLESIAIDGPFQSGQTGTVKVSGQSARKFRLTEVKPYTVYNEQFLQPLGGKLNWDHSIEDLGSTRRVTFKITVSGPSAFIYFPVAYAILSKDLAPTVEDLIRLAEAE